MTSSQQIFIICTQLLRHQYILTLSILVSFHLVELAGHRDTKFQVTLVCHNDIWQVIFRKERQQNFFTTFQFCFVISLIVLRSSCA